MSRKYKFVDKESLYFISFATVGWLDLFVREEYMQTLIESWKYCQQNKGLEIYSWCIMPSHIHMIVGTNGQTLDKTIGEMKSFTSRALRKQIENHTAESRKEWLLEKFMTAGEANSANKDWQLWANDSHPILLFDKEIFDQKLAYIHFNPVVAGFVEKEEHWKYSSAIDFANGKGLIELTYGY